MTAKVLVVDDEEDYRLIISDILASEGLDIRTASDGQEALEVLKGFSPDLILLDWMMPRMDGEGFCRKMRVQERYRRTPILMLTVKQTADEEMEALHFGVDDFIIKPFKAPELVARIRAALRRSQASSAR